MRGKGLHPVWTRKQFHPPRRKCPRNLLRAGARSDGRRCAMSRVPELYLNQRGRVVTHGNVYRACSYEQLVTSSGLPLLHSTREDHSQLRRTVTGQRGMSPKWVEVGRSRAGSEVGRSVSFRVHFGSTSGTAGRHL